MIITPPVRTITYGVVADFDAIRPGERDIFSFDFSPVIDQSAGSVVIESQSPPSFGITVAADSPVSDILPLSRLIYAATVEGFSIKALVGDMVDGAIYILSATAPLNDGRQLIWTARVECTSIVSNDLTVGKFRADFPEFTEGLYPDEVVKQWINFVQNDMPFNAHRFGDMLLTAQELWVAHTLTIRKQTARQAAQSGVGMAIGSVASRSVGPVSVSYDLSASYQQDAGIYNQTPYGQMLWDMMMRVGAGPIQL